MNLILTLANGRIVPIINTGNSDETLLELALSYPHTKSILVVADDYDFGQKDITYQEVGYKHWAVKVSQKVLDEIYHFDSINRKIDGIKYLRNLWAEQHPEDDEHGETVFSLHAAKLTYEEIVSGHQNHNETFYVYSSL